MAVAPLPVSRSIPPLEGVDFHAGDTADVLGAFPENHFHAVVTSPPYWGLRSYLPADHPSKSLELGTEKTPADYVSNVVDAMAAVKRVLREDGTVWIVLGDGYSSGGRTWRDEDDKLPARGMSTWPPTPADCKPKDLLGLPWMVAFGLRAAGWYLRSAVIWQKPSPMPGSQLDRCTTSYEHIFQLTKQASYYYDPWAVREAPTTETPRGATLRDVWRITSKGYKGAHFAVFPAALVERCLKLSTSERGCCAQCGAPRRRVVTTERVPTRPGSNGKLHTDDLKGIVNRVHHQKEIGHRDPQRHTTTVTGSRWTYGCEHKGLSVPCRVLDPWAGACTTGMVAASLGLDCTCVDLNPAYLEMGRERIAAYLETGKLR